MDSARPKSPTLLVSLKEASLILGVSVETLISWNEHQILKPTFNATGEIGYTKDQIDQFIRIQQSLQEKRAQLLRAQPLKPQSPTILSAPREKSRSAATGFYLLLAGGLLIIGGALFFQQRQITSLLGSYQKMDLKGQPEAYSGTSNPEVVIPSSVVLDKDNAGQSQFTKSVPTPASNHKGPIIASGNQPSRVPIATVAGITKFQQSKPQDIPDTTTYASVANTTPQKKDSAFDKSGNISGTTSQSTQLAINVIGGTAIAQTSQSNELGNDSRNQTIFLVMAIGALAVFFVRGLKRSQPVVTTDEETTAFEKVMEINQRMDGTVVLSFQGKDYKISKPEMHSDSDRFIERLMEVVQTGVKEIEYDNIHDETMKLSTPLSRVVTRLGFVGTLRDLFFPRTSKHTVLFRKYITNADLQGMHIVPEEVVKEIRSTQV